MPTRYRWFRIRIPRPAIDLTAVFAKCPFVADAPYGFAQSDSKTWRFRFLWRTTVIVTRLDEDGSPVYEEVASVSFTDFAVVSIRDMTFLRIENPGRSVRDLLNALESLLGLGFTASAVTFDRFKPTTIFQQVHVSKLVGLTVVGAVVKADTVARMEFVSKQGMVVENMQVLRGLQYKVELAIFELIYEGVRGQVAFSSNGAVKISGQLTPRLVHLIEQDLPELGQSV